MISESRTPFGRTSRTKRNSAAPRGCGITRRELKCSSGEQKLVLSPLAFFTFSARHEEALAEKLAVLTAARNASGGLRCLRVHIAGQKRVAVTVDAIIYPFAGRGGSRGTPDTRFNRATVAYTPAACICSPYAAERKNRPLGVRDQQSGGAFAR